MAAKLNCMARPDEAFGPQAPGVGASSARDPTSSTRTPIHYGNVTVTTPLPSASRSHSRSTSRTASHALSRGKAIQSPQTSEESDQQEKPVKSPTSKRTQKMMTQAIRFSGCHRCLMLPQQRRLRANRARSACVIQII